MVYIKHLEWIIIFGLVFSILALSVSALITKEFSKDDNMVLLKDSATHEEFITVKLLENTDQCFSCHTIYEICNIGGKDLFTDSWDIKFYDAHNIPININTQFEFLTTEEKIGIDNIMGTCEEEILVLSNETLKQSMKIVEYPCVIDRIETPYIIDRLTQSNFKQKYILLSGECIKVKISGNLKKSQSIDNVLNVMGSEINEFVWWNNSWDSKYTISYTCNNPDGNCTNEWVAIDYTNATNCDTDLRVVYQNTSEIPFEINDTIKLVYFFVNGTQGIQNTNYALFCNNDDAVDGSDNEVMMVYEDCNDLSEWLYEDAANTDFLINEDGSTINRTGFGNSCNFTVLNAGGTLDWAYRKLQPSTDLSMVYHTLFAKPASLGDPISNMVLGVRSGLEYDGVHTYMAVNTFKYFDTASHDIQTNMLNKWYIVKYPIRLDDTNNFDIIVDTSLKITNANFRSTFTGTMNYAVIGAEFYNASKTDLEIDEYIVSRYNVSIYKTKGTFILGAEETTNIIPVVTTPTIIPSPIYSNDQLNCSTTPTDAENTTLNVDFAWWLNYAICNGCGYNVTVITSNNTLTYTTKLVSEQLFVGDSWTCMVRAYDGFSYSAWKNITEQVLNTPPTWVQPIPNYTYYYSENIFIDINATDIDPGETLYYDINNTGFDINHVTGIINKTLFESDVGNHTIVVNATDDWGAVIDFTFNIEVYNYTISPPTITTPTTAIIGFDLSTTSNAIILFIMVFFYVCMLVIGMFFENFAFMTLSFFLGIVIGIMLFQLGAFISVVILFFNIAMMVSYGVKNK